MTRSLTVGACGLLIAACSTVDVYVTRDGSSDDGDVRDASRKDSGLVGSDASGNVVSGAAKLSETGLYSDFASRTIDPSHMVVSPRYPLWSDGDTKVRYLHLPPGSKIDTSDPDNWRFPVGTKMWKEFRVGNVLVETRLIEKVTDAIGADAWWKTAYAWAADGSDAFATVNVVPNALGTSHEIPSQQQCLVCHGNVADALIGLGVIQQSGTGTIGKLAADGRFTVPVVEREIPGDGDVKAALGYMHGNCGHCHNDVGWVHEVTALRLRVLLAADKPVECGAYGAIYLKSQHVIVSDAGVPMASSTIAVAACSGCEHGVQQESVDGSPVDAAVDRDAPTPPDGSDASQCEASLPILDFVPVPHGTFTMGSPLTEPGRGKFSETQVQVTLTHDIEMTKTEISQGQWSAMCFANPSGTITTTGALGGSFTDGVGSDYPVGAMTYWDALSFANALSIAKGYPACYKLSDCTGTPGGGASNGLLCRSISLTSATTYECSGYRLPTDAEFEYADRAGTTTATYAGDVLDRPDGGAVCYPDPNIDGIGWGCELPIAHSTQPVAKKKPNAFGLYDLIGNAFEWVDGDYNGLGYGPGPLVDPFGDVKLSLTSLGFDDPTGIWRGGQIAGLNALCRSAARLSAFRVASSAQYSTGPAVGFRIVRTVK